MDAPRVDNRTDFAVALPRLYARDGERQVVIVKSTWLLEPGAPALSLATEAERRPVRYADEPWGDPAESSPRYPADAEAAEKTGTDVVVVADAWAPMRRDGSRPPVAQFDAEARVGALRSMVRVHGPRVFVGGRGWGVTTARPTTRVPLRWEFAFGGRDTTDLAQVVEEPRNPYGRGVVREPEARTHQPAPQIERPDTPLGLVGVTPAPAGMGVVGRTMRPRRDHLGTYDDAWLETWAPFPPEDRDPRFAQVAPPELHAEIPLRGGEPVVLARLSPYADVLRCQLPTVATRVEVSVKGRAVVRASPPIDTVIVDSYPWADEALAAAGRTEAPWLVVEVVQRTSVPAARRTGDVAVRIDEVGQRLMAEVAGPRGAA
ncbi:MAG: DUF2169 domain-containing protein [Myxococcota bacterium]